MKLFAKKSLGQHFLNSKHVLEQIITAGNIQPGENILEIGPGTGILTEALLLAGARVTAIEKDHRAYTLLTEKFAEQISTGALSLIQGDVLEEGQGYRVQGGENAKPTPYTLCPQPYALIANIPYYITGAILEKFLEYEPRPNRMVLLVQKEVADRIIARPEQSTGKSKESILSISVKVFGTPKMIAKVAPGAFTPPPTVDSAILSIDHISATHFDAMCAQNHHAIQDFFKIVRAGFAHKRKFLKRNLESVIPTEELNSIWTTLRLDEKIRAEDLEPGQWMQIQNRLA